MRVLHCAGFHDTKLYYRSNYYLEGLAVDHGCQVLMLASDLSYPHIGQKKERIREPDPEIPYTLHRKSAVFHFTDAVFFPVGAEVDEFKPDIVHIYEGRQYATYLIARKCWRCGIPFVYEQEQRCDGSSFHGKLWSRLFVRRWLRWIAKRASLIRVVTPGALEYINEVSGVDLSSKCDITTLGFNDGLFYADDTLRDGFRRRLGIDDDEVTVAITGKFARWKRLEIPIDAFKETPNKKLRLLIQGSFENGLMEEVVERAKDDPRISISSGLLDRPSLNEFYNGVDYLVWTSPTNSFFEALGTNTKIIIPYGDGTSHLASDNIVFFGDPSSVTKGSGVVFDYERGKAQLKAVFGALSAYEKKDGGKERFSTKGIVQELYNQYLGILSDRKKN